MKQGTKDSLEVIGVILLASFIILGVIALLTKAQTDLYKPYQESLVNICSELGMNSTIEGFALSEPTGYCFNETNIIKFYGKNNTWIRQI